MSLILAIDLGKYNSVLCAFAESTGEVEFRTAKTTPAVMRAELTRQPVDRVVIKACSPAGWVHDLSSFPNSVWERKGAKLRFARLSMSNTVLRASVQFLDEFKTEF